MHKPEDDFVYFNIQYGAYKTTLLITMTDEQDFVSYNLHFGHNKILCTTVHILE